jgi:hypothetical protein
VTNLLTATIAQCAKGFRVAFCAGIVVASLALAAAPAAVAAEPPAYDSIPTTLPGNVPSVSFEATSTSEFGDYIALAGTDRASDDLPVTIVMSIWACETGGSTGDDCTTTPGDTWAQPLTLTIYNVDHSATVPAAGSVVLTTTQTFDLPYRPSYEPSGPCPVSGNYHPWHSTVDNGCYNGLAHEVTFTLPSGHTLPDELIWGISFNTQNYGSAPTGKSGPYNSLNVGTKTFSGEPSYGADVEPNGVFQNSLWAGEYGDNGANGLGTFRDDTGTINIDWSDYKPLACFAAACTVSAPTGSPSPSATPYQSIEGATGTPYQSIEGATGTPGRITPPPTSTGATSGGGTGSTFALLICVVFGGAALAAVVTQRRAVRL